MKETEEGAQSPVRIKGEDEGPCSTTSSYHGMLPTNMNMFAPFNASPGEDDAFNMDGIHSMHHRSPSPSFGLNDDLYGSLPFRSGSPEFAGSAFYDNSSPMMHVNF